VFEGYVKRVAADTIIDSRVVDLDDAFVGRDLQIFEEKKRILTEKKIRYGKRLEV
jgi:hypothetical protein